RHKSKGLCLSGLDHFPYVDAHFAVNLLEFIDERNVDSPKNILCNFDGLRRCRRRYVNCLYKEAIIKRNSKGASVRIFASDHLWDLCSAVVLIPGIFPLGRKCQEEVLAALQSTFFKDRPQHFFGSAWKGRGFQNNQLARSKIFRDRIAR